MRIFVVGNLPRPILITGTCRRLPLENSSIRPACSKAAETFPTYLIYVLTMEFNKNPRPESTVHHRPTVTHDYDDVSFTRLPDQPDGFLMEERGTVNFNPTPAPASRNEAPARTETGDTPAPRLPSEYWYG